MTGRTRAAGPVVGSLPALAAAAALALTGCSANSSGGKAATPDSLLAAGLAAQQQGNLGAAKQLFQQVVDKDPRNYYAHYDLGVIAQKQNDNTTALREYGLALTANPHYVPAMFNEATIYGVTDPPLAITTYRMVISLQAHAPTAYLNLGLLEAKTGQLKAAVRDLRTALQQDPTLAGNVPKSLQKKLAGAPKHGASPSPSASTG